jgi:hypothetical protein
MERGKGRGGPRFTTKPKCGGQTRGNDPITGGPGDKHPCRRVAGHGTDHLGTGRCMYHGGCSPTKHGLYSKVVKAKRQVSYQAALAAEDPKSMLEHIALIDGVILPGALERGEKAPIHPGQPDPLQVQLQAIDIRSKVVKWMNDMEQSKKISFTKSELKLLVMQLVTIVAEYVDAQTLRKISARIGAGTLPAVTV